MQDEIFYRRRLPHLQPKVATFFVTTRIAGSLPLHAIQELKEEQAMLHRQITEATNEEMRNRYIFKLRSRYFGKFEDYVNRVSVGPRWLANEQVAGIVSEAIRFRDGNAYNLLCYTLMPNHVHMVFSTDRNDIPLDKIMQSLKRYTAREANKILGREGAFWHHESYDHVVRDGAELERILQYVLLNPVKAGLCKSWKNWKWSYIRPDLVVLD
jgi:putative transposase